MATTSAQCPVCAEDTIEVELGLVHGCAATHDSPREPSYFYPVAVVQTCSCELSSEDMWRVADVAAEQYEPETQERDPDEDR